MKYSLNIRAYWFGFMLSAVFATGCAPAGEAPSERKNATPASAVVAEPRRDSSSDSVAELAADEYWETVFLQGSPVGYVHTRREPVEVDGRSLWRTTTETQLDITRFGQASMQQSKIESVETESGQLIRFATESTHGAAPIRSSGEVVSGQLVMKTTIDGRESTSRVPWNDRDGGGFDAVNKSLLGEPLAPGDLRTVRTLMPDLGQPSPVSIRLAARDWEQVDVAGQRMRLLRVDALHELAGGATMNVAAWVDERGDILRTEPVPGMVIARTTKEVALRKSTTAPTVDIGFDKTVRIDLPAGDLHRASRVEYRLTLADGRPADVFAKGRSQLVAPTDEPHKALVTVVALRAGEEGVSDEAPKAAYVEANSLVQSDDPRIRELAAQAVAQATNDAEKAAALERFVHDYMRQVSFSQAFGTAAEVAASREGDCTEYAVLLAALARATGIPSRVAVGLVYTRAAGEPAFAFHMWDELYVDGAWIPYDATLGLGGIGGGHLKLNDSHLGEGSALASFLPVAQVMGQLKIEVLDVEP